MVFQPDFFASADLLCTADEHERGDRYGDKAVENNKKDCTPEEREYNPLNQFLNFFICLISCQPELGLPESFFTGIQINFHTTVLLASGSRTVVSYGVSFSQAFYRCYLRWGNSALFQVIGNRIGPL